MARKKTVTPATDVERLSDQASQCVAAIDDLRRRLGEAERRLDELRHLPLTTLAIREDVAAIKTTIGKPTWMGWLLGR